jgi:hypothetical protein
VPLASAREDLETFSEDDGVVISTPDLFRVLEGYDSEQYEAVRNSIKSACGRWTLQSISA